MNSFEKVCEELEQMLASFLLKVDEWYGPEGVSIKVVEE